MSFIVRFVDISWNLERGFRTEAVSVEKERERITCCMLTSGR